MLKNFYFIDTAMSSEGYFCLKIYRNFYIYMKPDDDTARDQTI